MPIEAARISATEGPPSTVSQGDLAIDVGQAEIVLRQLQSCSIQQLDHIGNELVKDMIADNVCVFSLGD
jgi:hypothetical protein